MASDPERQPVDDDTVVVEDGRVPGEEAAQAVSADADTIVVESGRAASEDVTQTGKEWPVNDLYYVDGAEAAPDVETEEPTAVASMAAPAAAPRRRLPRDVGVHGMIGAVALVAALILGAVILQRDGDDEAPPVAETTTAPAETVPPVETSPAPPAGDEIEVPAVSGMRLADAREAIEAEGLGVRVTRSISNRPRGEVLRQTPVTGSKVPSDIVVALVVSAGPSEAPTETGPTDVAQVEVPDVVGQSRSEAVAALRELGLEPRVTLVTSSARGGTVVAQSPFGGAEIAEGGRVRLDVAKPSPVTRIEVPNVVGSTAADARRELRSLGFTVRTTTVDAQEPAGVVIEQSPRAGSELREGGAVTLRVSSGPAKVDVPDVTGLDEPAARAELEGAGFEVRVTDESTTDPAQDGIVLRQSPTGGSRADDGAIVTIVVARFD
jgi:serine/threonine-protein kinase